MHNSKIISFLLLLLALFSSSCQEELRPYKSFDAKSKEKGKVRIGIANQNIDLIAIDDDGIARDYTSKLYVKMFGPPAQSDVHVNFVIDPISEAQLGVHFTLSDTKFEIPEGLSSASIDITIKNSALTLDHFTPFKYTLTGAEGYEIDSMANFLNSYFTQKQAHRFR